MSWPRGLDTVLGDYWDGDADIDACLSRVFVVDVPDREWCCLIGGWFADTGEESRLVEACTLVSRLRGEAYAFTTQGRMDGCAWMAASNGVVRRRFVSSELPVDEGKSLAGESEMEVGEGLVLALASRHAAGPYELGGRPRGLLATTPWGRENGVPLRTFIPTRSVPNDGPTGRNDRGIHSRHAS